MVKSARPFLVAALLAIVGACAPTKEEPVVTPVAALPEAPLPMMVPPIAPPPPHVVHSAPKRLSAVKKHTKKEHRLVRKSEKGVKVAKHSKKKKHSHHSKVAKASGRHAPAATKFASRAKPAPASVPLDSPMPAMPAMPAPAMAPTPGPLTPGLR